MKELQTILERVNKMNDHLKVNSEKLIATLEKHIAEKRILKTALEFYAKGKHYDRPRIPVPYETLIDKGEVAQKALDELK